MRLKLGKGNIKRSAGTSLGRSHRGSKLLTYLVALIISIGFWFVQSLQSTTITTIKIPIDYSYVLTKYYFSDNMPSYIEVEVKDKVSHLMSFSDDSTASIKMIPQKIGNNYYLKMTRKDIVDYISSILPATTSVLKVFPASINYTLNPKKRKSVSIYVNEDILPIKSGYMAYPIELSPSKIEIYGDKKDLDTINQIRIKLPKLKSISDTISFEAKTILPKGITSQIDSVRVVVPVELISQLQLTLPINVVGQPQDTTLYTLPSTAQISIAMPISKLRKLKEDKDLGESNQVAIGVLYPRDKESLSSSDMSSLDVQLIEKPRWVTSYTITPSKVQYILETKKRR